MGSSRNGSSGDYEVFLSFRGRDTRQGFVSVLYAGMVGAKIRVFKDDKAIRIGDKIDGIFEAIANSKICVPIFSPDFVHSKYCLLEVTKMVELNKTIIPIFYNVTSDDVKLKTPLYSNILRGLEDKYGYDEVKMWKQALKEVVSNKGGTLGDITYIDFCNEFVAQVSSKLHMGMGSHEGAPVGQDFVVPIYPIDLAIVPKLTTWPDGIFDVTDSIGTIIFKLKAYAFTLHDRRELLDASGKTLVTLHKKVFSLHDRWRAFRGQSTNEKDLLFMVKRSEVEQFKTKLYVYIGLNPDEDVWNYRVEGSWLERSCVVYSGNTNVIVAQMYKKNTVLMGEDHFGVTVYPNIDYAFIFALVAILNGENMEATQVKN